MSARRITLLALLVAGLSLLMLLGTYVAQTMSPDEPWRVRYLAQQFNLARENNAAAWYASMLLLAVALAMAACFVLDARGTGHRGSRVLALGWLALSALFAGLSLDELGSLHERINSVRMVEDMRNPLRIDVAGWVGILAVPGALAGGGAVAFGWLRLRHVGSALALMCVGVLLFATIPLQEALEVEAAAQRHGVDALLLEEGTELLASLCLLLAAVRFAYVHAAEGAGHERFLAFAPRLDVLIGVEAVLALGMAFVHFGLPEVMDLQDARGVPRNWFPAALAFVIALFAAHVASASRADRAAPAPAAWWLVALVHVALSIDHGSAHRFSESLLSGTIGLRWTLAAALAGLIVAAAALLAFGARHSAARLAVAGWAMLLLAATVLPAERAWLAFGAYALLLPALVSMLPRPASGPAARADRSR